MSGILSILTGDDAKCAMKRTCTMEVQALREGIGRLRFDLTIGQAGGLIDKS